MPSIIEGKSKAEQNDKFAIIVSKFNSFITEKLLEGSLQTLRANGANEKNIGVIKVPGAFEIPTCAKNLIDLNKYDAIICLGCVIKGETPHFDYICSAVSDELAYLGATTGIPVIFGILTCENIDEANDRAGGRVGNKGSESALAAIEMVNVLSKLKDKTIKVNSRG